MIGKFIILLSSVIISSVVKQDSGPIEKARWLIGTWENKTSRGTIYETWTGINDNELAGKSYILKEKDTIVFENVRLLQEQDNLFYIPTVKDQNGGLPVRFALKNISDNSLLFENPLHDFPQQILYRRINDDSVVATISGTKNGKQREQAFPMKRVNSK